ncbi:hypothetical protein K2P47_02640 [Patescibacteria group bacterium]|nr:hypothetical protein [Patescibacteria group bacterium]
MGRDVVKYKPVKKSKPVVHTWRNRRQKPWTSFCDTRAIVAVMIRLHELDRQEYLSLAQVLDFIAAGDLGCLPSLRRTDIIEAFYGRHDVSSVVPVLIAHLVMEGVLITECVYEKVSKRLRVNPDEVPSLNAHHATVDRNGSESAKFTVVS